MSEDKAREALGSPEAEKIPVKDGDVPAKSERYL